MHLWFDTHVIIESIERFQVLADERTQSLDMCHSIFRSHAQDANYMMQLCEAKKLIRNLCRGEDVNKEM